LGVPERVYARPADRWTAGFVGDVNVLAGVRRGAGVETDIGLFDLPRGDRATRSTVASVVDGRPEIIAAGRATNNLIIYWNRTE
jgi:ABC-type Fe3+/spermidine/putrescine transport system ATPase subunit